MLYFCAYTNKCFFKGSYLLLGSLSNKDILCCSKKGILDLAIHLHLNKSCEIICLEIYTQAMPLFFFFCLILTDKKVASHQLSQDIFFFPSLDYWSLGETLWTFPPSLKEQKQTNHIVLSGIFLVQCFSFLPPFRHFSHSEQRSQWFLTSRLDKLGGYKLIPLICLFSHAVPKGSGTWRK